MGLTGCAPPAADHGDSTDTQALAILPFQVLEALDLPAQYERSFKMCPGGLFAQRYLLGVPALRVATARLAEAARRLGMPQDMRPCFDRALEGASTALFGFEDGPHGPVLKAYAEHRSRLGTAQVAASGPEVPSAPVELFRGFKWQVACRPASKSGVGVPGSVPLVRALPGVQTVYRAQPGLSAQQVRLEAAARLADVWATPLREAVLGILQRAHRARPGFAALWLDLGELDGPVRGFDLNLYDAGLRVSDSAEEVLALARVWRIEPVMVQRLLAAAGPGWLGHVSAGRGRDGQPYLTLYFEP